MSTKDAAIEMIRAMPDGATWADIVAVGREKFGPVEDEDLTREDWEADWADEINRRVEEIRSGRAKMIPGDEVMKELREKFG